VYIGEYLEIKGIRIMYNQELYDRVVQHLADTRLYEAETSTNVSRGVRRHQKRLRVLLNKDIKADVKPEVTRATRELHTTATNAISDYSDAAITFHTNNLEKTAGGFFQVRKPKGSEVLKEIIGPNIETSKTLKNHFDSIGSAELIRIQQIIGRGLAENLNKKDIIDSVLKTTNISEHQVKSLVRTSITRTQSLALTRVMNENKEILAGYRFTAVLDARTSPICSYHDGRVYDIDDTRYLPPLHWNCRSSLVPVLKSKKDMEKVDSERIRKDKLARVLAESLSGEPVVKEDYSGWLKRQPMNVKLSHLGDEERVSLFEKGVLTVKEFFTTKGRQIGIAALRRLDNARTAVFPTRQHAIANTKSNEFIVDAVNPRQLMTKAHAQTQLRAMYIADAESMNQAMSLTDFRGTTLQGKRVVRLRANNEFDGRNTSWDPFTGEQSSTLLYDPDYIVYQERLDFMKNSKVLTQEQKKFIEEFADSLEDQVSVNNQSVIVENLRLLFERYAADKKEWGSLMTVARNEAQYSVVNVSRILDRRSRERSELFATYTSGEEPKVQIFGKYYTFDELVNNHLDNQRYVDNWTNTIGRSLARESYYTGRAPLKAYFLPPDKKFLNFDFISVLTKWIKKEFPLLDEAKELLSQKRPTEGQLSAFIRKHRETYRKIVDLEFLFAKKKQSYIDQMIETGIGDKQAINVMANIMGLIADGKSTDYDSLAINIGKALVEKWAPLFPFHGSTLQDFHASGSRILEGLRQQGKIKIAMRGKTRRAVIDLDTGRPGGAWRDTVSREVTIVEPKMLELQSRNRQILLMQRLGVVSGRDKLYVRPDAKTYFDARGKDTKISIITRRASANYEELKVDRDFADMLNHAMSVRYEVDPEFATFMDDVVRFRDPRGNVKKYDELNDFRKLIIQRGDQGYGFMQTVKWHAQRAKPFTVIAQIDGRGRVYYQGYLTPTGGEVVRPFLNSAVPGQFGHDELKELMVQIGATLGPATEALTQAGRIEIFKRSEKQLLELGQLLMNKTQRDRRIREFLEHPIIRAHDAEEIPKITRLALEYARVHKHVNGNFNDVARLKSYETRLMIENDASSSGAQIIGLSTGDRDISVNSNVLQTTQKNRLYDLVAMDTVSDPEFQKISKLANANISWIDLQKAAKAQNMVSFYGAGKATQAANIEAKFADVLEKKGFLVITREEIRPIMKQIDREIKNAEYINADQVVFGLKQLKKEINEVIEGETPVGKELLDAARDAHPDVGAFVEKLVNVRSGLIGPSEFKQVSEIMSKHLAERAPITQRFVKFWNAAAKSFVEETEKVDVPWVTFDGKLLHQRYRPKIQAAIDFIDPQTGRRVRNIYEDSATDAYLLGKASISRARIGLGVNGNHMNDASIVRQFHLWGARNGVDTATIHDAFFTNIGDVTRAKTALREIYANSLEGDTIRKTLLAMKDEGLSNKTYNELLQRAKEEGLVDPPNKITRDEVLAPIRSGYDWYGIGP
jgi:SPP1 gp7 family putative phage head morphogenesis protein